MTAQPYLIKVTLDTAGGANRERKRRFTPIQRMASPFPPRRSPASFLGWSDGVTTHPAGAMFKGAADVTLTAGWQSNYAPLHAVRPAPIRRQRRRATRPPQPPTTTTKNPDGSVTTGRLRPQSTAPPVKRPRPRSTRNRGQGRIRDQGGGQVLHRGGRTKTEEKNVSISDKATGTSTTAQVVTDGTAGALLPQSRRPRRRPQ